MSDERPFGMRRGGRGLASIARPLAAAWRAGRRPYRAGLGLAAVVAGGLAGATLFGLVHIVGGAWHGNPRAVGFGIGLAGISTTLLAGLAGAMRRVVERIGQ